MTTVPLLVIRITRVLRTTVALGTRHIGLTDHPRSLIVQLHPGPTPFTPQKPMLRARPQPGLLHLLTMVVMSIVKA